MDHHRMNLAAKLLAKAQSTTFDAEAMSLVRRSCLILLGVVRDEETAGSDAHAEGDGEQSQDVGRVDIDWQPVEETVRSSERHVDVTA